MSPATEPGSYKWSKLPSSPVFLDASCPDRTDLSWNPIDEASPKARLAARVCLSCTHLVECGAYAIKLTPPLSGIWGALTTKQRIAVRRDGHKVADLLKARSDEGSRECIHCGTLMPSVHGLAIHMGRVHSET